MGECPVNSRESFGFKPTIGRRKMITAEKTAACRQGRRVSGFKYEMTGIIDAVALAAGPVAPEHENAGFASAVYCIDQTIADALPSKLAVATCRIGSDGHDAIE